MKPTNILPTLTCTELFQLFNVLSKRIENYQDSGTMPPESLRIKYDKVVAAIDGRIFHGEV